MHDRRLRARRIRRRIVAGPSTAQHELAGADRFLSGGLGTGIDLTGDFLLGSAVDPNYPACLTNIGESSVRRACFVSDEVRSQNIAPIVDSASRPVGETIWIGRFDEEAVAP